jgi:acetate kinase
VLGPSVPMVAVFDTAFHATLPQHEFTYALPHDLAVRHRVRRYGFHGIAHQYMLERYCQITGTRVGQATIITLQLGNGCSAAAIREGRSVDTSMGFTPLEGLVMGTRSGDIDPGIIGYLAEKEGLDATAVERLLNRESGLLGISGLSSDMRDLLAAEEWDEGTRLAVQVFCYRVRKYIGAYLTVLGGAQAVVFGEGIGENAPAVRARICEGMEWCGLRVDPERNATHVGTEGRISPDGAAIAAFVVAVDEAALIARYTLDALHR